MKLVITQDDIDKGEGGADKCPIARALNRLYRRKGYQWLVYGVSADAYSPGKHRRRFRSRLLSSRLLKRASKFVSDFDRGIAVKPCTISLTDPKEVKNARHS